MDLGEAIKKRRKELRITQADLAKRLDVHPTTVSDWERGALPRPQHFDGLALFLGLPRSDVAAIGTYSWILDPDVIAAYEAGNCPT